MSEKKKLGVALGGGGARGFAHLGVLQVLEENDIEVQVVTGTSIGALVGAAYAADKLPELVDFAVNIGIADLPFLLSPTVSSRGFFSRDGLKKKLNQIVQARTIEDLSKKFAAVSANLNSYEPVYHTTGSVYEAVRASISIPGLFTPVESNDQLLVDGGIIDPVPVRAAKDLGADIVLAVDLFGEPPPRERTEREKDGDFFVKESGFFKTQLKKLQSWIQGTAGMRMGENYFELLQHTLEASQKVLTNANLKESPPDIIISPQVSQINFLDFHKGHTLIDEGRKAVQPAVERLQSLLSIFLDLDLHTVRKLRGLRVLL